MRHQPERPNRPHRREKRGSGFLGCREVRLKLGTQHCAASHPHLVRRLLNGPVRAVRLLLDLGQLCLRAGCNGLRLIDRTFRGRHAISQRLRHGRDIGSCPIGNPSGHCGIDRCLAGGNFSLRVLDSVGHRFNALDLREVTLEGLLSAALSRLRLA